MSVNQATIDLIKQFEGCKLTAYQDIVGVWTIGYGITDGAGVGIKPAQGMTITQDRAEDLLRQAVDQFAEKVDALIDVKVTPNEFGACVSLAYNIGPNAFAKSTVLRELNVGHKDKAAAAFRMWNKAGGEVIKGLVNRREAEIKLFLTPVTADMHNVPEKAEEKSIWVVIINAILAIFKGSKK
jgi:GH24 family phage-related lysozyme (muramidase)